ncbi:MGA protein, partial [Probosciger aterrimus]|nr:MGA protein [Probosciger aterrimus]
QNVLTMTAINSNYADPNNLMFEEIKILGSLQEITEVTVSQNNVMENSPHSITYYPSEKVAHITGLQLDLGKSYTVKWTQQLNVNERFDCYPSPNPTQERCEQLGCVWDETSGPDIPSCYYSSDNPYSVDQVEYTSSGLAANLILNSANTKANEDYTTPISTLRLEVKYHLNHMLQFKIYDYQNTRYEVPVPLNLPSSPTSTDEERLYEVSVQKKPFGIQVRRKSTGRIIWDSQLPTFTFSDMFIQISTRLASQYIYGFGETEHTMFRRNMSWHTWGMFTRDQPPTYKLNSYGYQPFYMALEEDSNAHGVLLLNSNAMDVTFQPTPALTYRTIGGILDFYMVLGPTPELVVQEYTALIGRPVMPPYWSLGFQLCRYGYRNDSEIAQLVEDMKAARIPYDVQYADIDYMERQLDFTIGTRFAGLPALVNKIKEEGMRFIIILVRCFQTCIRFVFLLFLQLYGAHAAFPDFLRNSTAEWWKREILEFYNNPTNTSRSIKFDGLWIDMNEPATFLNGAIGGCRNDLLNMPPYVPRKNVVKYVLLFSRGYHKRNYYNLHNFYRYTKKGISGLQSATKERGIVITRSTYPSSGRWAGHWLGDNTAAWDQLTKSVIGMMEFSLFGISYTGADICGFFKDSEYELCIRWMELGIFYPYSRNHNQKGTRGYHVASSLAQFAKVLFNTFNKDWKCSLTSVISALLSACNMQCLIIILLTCRFVEDRTTWEIYEQFLWGPALLISPVMQQNAVTVNAYLPNARWYDYYTDEDIGFRGQFKLLPAPLEHINLHIRGGYILAWQKPANTTFYSRKNPMGLTVALNDTLIAEGQLYWDDGVRIDAYEDGVYLLTSFTANQNVLDITVLHHGYSDPNHLMFTEIKVLGVPFNVTQVTISQNGGTIASAHAVDYNDTKQLLTITNLQLELGKSYTVQWS